MSNDVSAQDAPNGAVEELELIKSRYRYFLQRLNEEITAVLAKHELNTTSDERIMKSRAERILRALENF